MWVTGEVSGEEGGVNVAILGADLAVNSFVAAKKDVPDPRRTPASRRESAAISSEDAHEIKARPRVGLCPPTLTEASRSPSKEANDEADEEEETETESSDRSEPHMSS